MKATMYICLALALVGTFIPVVDAGARDRGAQPVERSSYYFARDGIAAWRGEPFRITRIDTLDVFDAQRAMIENWVSMNAGQVGALQSAIRANKALSSALRARNVQINNVVSVQAAFNGRLVFYLR